jgi:hypothetical protein
MVEGVVCVAVAVPARRAAPLAVVAAAPLAAPVASPGRPGVAGGHRPAVDLGV